MEDQEDDIEMEDVSTEPELDSITAAVEKRSLIWSYASHFVSDR